MEERRFENGKIYQDTSQEMFRGRQFNAIFMLRQTPKMLLGLAEVLNRQLDNGRLEALNSHQPVHLLRCVGAAIQQSIANP